MGHVPLSLFNLVHKFSHMDPTSKRQTKRDSAKKAREHKVFTQKHIRHQEKNRSSKGQDKAKGG